MDETARATYTGKWWVVEVPEVDGALTQARRLDQVEAMVQDAVSMVEEVPPESVTVAVEPILTQPLTALIDEVQRGNSELEAMQAASSRRTRGLVSELRSTGMSVRDIGRIVGVSPLRVSQLVPLH
ncbi:MAG: type II toxin-antitoxin system HicB family antitoxin [Nocardioidaceae bacterium]